MQWRRHKWWTDWLLLAVIEPDGVDYIRWHTSCWQLQWHFLSLTDGISSVERAVTEYTEIHAQRTLSEVQRQLHLQSCFLQLLFWQIRVISKCIFFPFKFCGKKKFVDASFACIYLNVPCIPSEVRTGYWAPLKLELRELSAGPLEEQSVLGSLDHLPL